MMRRLLPVFLSMTMLGPLAAAAGAGDPPAAGLAAAGSGEKQIHAEPAAPARNNEQATPAKSNDGRIAATRSDGSTVRTKVPDPKEIRKLVGYMRDGMKRADQAERQRVTKKVIQYRPRSRR